MTKQGNRLRTPGFANSGPKFFNCFWLSEPRSPQPCKASTRGYFLPGSIRSGLSIR